MEVDVSVQEYLNLYQIFVKRPSTVDVDSLAKEVEPKFYAVSVLDWSVGCVPSGSEFE